MEILPAIIEDTYEEVARRMQFIGPHVGTVQIDLADGVFVPRTTWLRIGDLVSVHSAFKIDLHAMVHDPLRYAQQAESILPIRRITFHIESTDCVRATAEYIHHIGREVGLAINPDTAVGALAPFIDAIDAVLVMGVRPGWGGQDYIPATGARVRDIKQHWPHIMVGVDGGIHLRTGSAQECVNAGADFLVAGSGIFKAHDPLDALRRFQALSPTGL